MAPGLQTQCEGSLLIVAEWTINDLFRSGKLQDEEGRRIKRELDLRSSSFQSTVTVGCAARI
jgi:hypothetical protein